MLNFSLNLDIIKIESITDNFDRDAKLMKLAITLVFRQNMLGSSKNMSWQLLLHF